MNERNSFNPETGVHNMKIRSMLMMTAAAVLLAAPAMANSPPVVGSTKVVRGSDIIVYTDMNGNITKQEYLNYQSRRFDEAAANSRNGRVMNDQGRLVSKDEFLFDQSQKFDDLDTMRNGRISRASFEALEVTMVEPAAGGRMAGESTSRPQAYNQAVPTSHIPGGADGAGGWTAQ
jgi:hypothetical protein